MEKKRNSLIALILIVLMVISIGLTGCGKSEKTDVADKADQQKESDASSKDKDKQDEKSTDDSNSNDEGGLPIVKEATTLKYWVPMHGSATKIMKSYNENEVYKELEKRTGVHIEFIHPPAGQAKEQFNLMIASKDLPDIISQLTDGYPGGVDKAIDDGVYLRLNELIDKYAPNYKKIREENAEIARQTITDEGNIWSFPCIQTTEELPWWGLLIRNDWLEDVELEMPTTIDEWHTVLTAFKEKKGAEAPLMFPKEGYDWGGMFVGAFDIGPGFYQQGGKVKYGFIEPGFKDYLAEMNKWYDEGLIDKDFATRDDKSYEAMITSGKSGALPAAYEHVAVYESIMKSNDPKVKFSPAPYPSLESGKKVQYREKDEFNKGCDTVITTSCEKPEVAVKWLDYAYGDEGSMLFNWGIEGVSYELVEGNPQFTELMTNNPDGLAYSMLSWKYKLHMGPYKRDWKAFAGLEKVEDCMKTWGEAGTDYVMPRVQLSDEESRKYSNKMNEINTFVEEKILKFVMGVEPIDKFEKFVEQVKKMGIDEAIDIKQAALDRYNAR